MKETEPIKREELYEENVRICPSLTRRWIRLLKSQILMNVVRMKYTGITDSAEIEYDWSTLVDHKMNRIESWKQRHGNVFKILNLADKFCRRRQDRSKLIHTRLLRHICSGCDKNGIWCQQQYGVRRWIFLLKCKKPCKLCWSHVLFIAEFIKCTCCMGGTFVGKHEDRATRVHEVGAIFWYARLPNVSERTVIVAAIGRNAK